MPEYVEKPTIITLKVQVRGKCTIPFADWQAKLNALIPAFPGFISLEFLSITGKKNEWTIVQRFFDAESASAWCKSQPYQELRDELQKFVTEDGIQEASANEANLHNGVTEVIIAEVNPEKESAYREWSAKMHQVEAKFPGFRGVYVQSPVHNRGRYWITLLQFDTARSLDQWLKSSERLAVLKESAPLITSLETHRVISPYSGWFASIAKVGESPPLWKQTMIILLVLFPIVMLELRFLNPLLQGLDISLGTFIGNAISVTLISWPMMPIAIFFLGWWLSPEKEKRLQATIIGTCIVLLLYLLEIIVFWNFM